MCKITVSKNNEVKKLTAFNMSEAQKKVKELRVMGYEIHSVVQFRLEK